MAVRPDRYITAFSAALRDARAERGITQQKLADEAGYALVYVNNLERGLYQPSLTSLMCLEAALGLEAGELVRRTGVHLRALPPGRTGAASRKPRSRKRISSAS